MMTAVEKVLFLADTTDWVREHGGDNRGENVEAYLRAVGCLPGDPWCAAWVSWIGEKALGDAWPLPLTGSCDVLGDFARAKGMLVDRPEPGDVFILWRPGVRFYHTGFVTGVLPGDRYTTIEGNTNADGSANGYGVFRRTRNWREQDGYARWQGFVL